MPRMRAPYTGIVFDVLPENVEKRIARGFALLDQHELPTADSTISEIRSWAEANGVELPAKGTKAALLAAVEGAAL